MQLRGSRVYGVSRVEEEVNGSGVDVELGRVAAAAERWVEGE